MVNVTLFSFRFVAFNGVTGRVMKMRTRSFEFGHCNALKRTSGSSEDKYI